jgi:hypothetical protein
MAQTPARDFIRDAEVDFRFYGGSARNHANSAHALVWSSNQPIIQPVHGVPALVYCDGGAPQSWMAAAQTALTLEALISLDMMHLGTGEREQHTLRILDGDWSVGFTMSPEAGETFDVSLWVSFNGATFGDTYWIGQPLTAAPMTLSQFKGAMMHVVIAAEYAAGVDMSVTSCLNGLVTDATTENVPNHSMTAEPTNTVFDTASVNSSAVPFFLLRMWDTYQDDADVLADLYRSAKAVVPGGRFPEVTGTAITFSALS